MKKVLFLLAFLVTTLSFSQRTINLGDFSVVKVYNGLSLKIERSDEQKIVITGEKKQNVSIKNVNGKLKIGLKFPEIYDDEHVKVTLYYKNNLDILDANEGAAIFSDETFKQNNVTIKSQEGAYIHLVLDVEFLSVKAVSGGNIRLRGNVKEQDVEITTGAVYDGFELNSNSCDVTSASGGKAHVYATELLDASVRFGGQIEYKGNPADVKTNKIIGGNIKNKG